MGAALYPSCSLCEGAWRQPGFDTLRELDSYQEMTSETLADMVARNQPVVLRGILKNSTAVRTQWTDSYLQKHMDHDTPVFIETLTSGEEQVSEPSLGPSTIKQFLSRYVNEEI